MAYGKGGEECLSVAGSCLAQSRSTGPVASPFQIAKACLYHHRKACHVHSLLRNCFLAFSSRPVPWPHVQTPTRHPIKPSRVRRLISPPALDMTGNLYTQQHHSLGQKRGRIPDFAPIPGARLPSKNLEWDVASSDETNMDVSNHGCTVFLQTITLTAQRYFARDYMPSVLFTECKRTARMALTSVYVGT